MSTKAELFLGESILRFIHQSQHQKIHVFASWHSHYNQSGAVLNISGKREHDISSEIHRRLPLPIFPEGGGTSIHKLVFLYIYVLLLIYFFNLQSFRFEIFSCKAPCTYGYGAIEILIIIIIIIVIIKTCLVSYNCFAQAGLHTLLKQIVCKVT